MTWSRFTIGLLCSEALRCLAGDCPALGRLELEGAIIESAAIVNSPKAPSHCRVVGIASSGPDSRIGFEVWLPVHGWNGKFAGAGNGGWGGSINSSGLSDLIRRGYAAASTDTGHSGASASFAMGHPEKLEDFGHRAVHLMTVHAKSIVEAFYGRAPDLSYFTGCSSGGRQGLMEAQRYPGDYDGIVAGAPTNNWTNLMFGRMWVAQATLLHRDSWIPPTKYPHIHAAALAACDAQDGLTDGLISHPPSCKFDPASIACKGRDAEHCLTPAQVQAAQRIYAAATNPKTGERIYFPMERGSELVWKTLAGGPLPIRLADDFFRYVVFENADWDFRTLNFDSHVGFAHSRENARISANDTNLKPFFDHGGKLLQYHGWTDQQVMPGNSIHYFESVAKTLGGPEKIARSYRLFLAPGMNHCGGGDGPNEFDALGALERWVEYGEAPAALFASQKRNGTTIRSRPICSYPLQAIYDGSGDPASASSFRCQSR